MAKARTISPLASAISANFRAPDRSGRLAGYRTGSPGEHESGVSLCLDLAASFICASPMAAAGPRSLLADRAEDAIQPITLELAGGTFMAVPEKSAIE